MSSVPPGWYADPDGRPIERFWDGNAWTSESRPLSYLQGKSAPQAKHVGLDQNEKILLVVVGVAILLAYLLFP